MALQALRDVIRADPRFSTRRKWLLFSELVFAPTGEKVEEGFRYFSCPVAPLVECLSRRDLGALINLPFALDDEDDPDTSSVLVDLAYTASGAFLAAQPVEYQSSAPVPVAPALVWPEPEARALIGIVKQLDQSS